ncbi:MAG: ribonuclease HI [Clostridiales bacterium]|nr:ribonuclease HI [Clostridiales bacterium]
MAELTEVTIYTDGACSGNPGPGGWGSILMVGPHKKELSGGEAVTTNNRMELMAVIKALEALTRKCKVNIYSDSAYVVNAFNQDWISGWIRNGWKNSAKAPVANSDLWKRLIELTSYHETTFIKVKGHADNEYNNRCDQLAVEQSRLFAGKEGE